MQPTPSPSMAAPAVERRRQDRRAPLLPKDVAVSHYRGQVAEEHLNILLPAARRASLALARFTPAGLHEGRRCTDAPRAGPLPGAAAMSPARPTFGQMVTRLDPELKARLKMKAKANGRSLNAEAVYRLDVEGRLRADLAAGRTPVIAEPAAPVIATLAEPAAAPAPEVSAAPQEAWELLHDLRDACLEPDTDTCIPSSLGRRLQAITAMFPRARA